LEEQLRQVTVMSAALRSTRILTGVMVAVVFSFLLATFVTRMREQEMARWLSTLIGSAMPSVQQLSHARTELRRLMQELDAAADSGSPAPVRAVQNAFHNVLAAYESYIEYPPFPGEKPLVDVTRQNLAILKEYLDRIQPDARISESERQTIRQEVYNLDDALLRLVDFNAAQGGRIGAEISRIRLQAASLGVALDLIAVTLAVVATIMALRMLKASLQAMEARANELDLFAGRVAHDLKGPLTGIVLAATLGEHSAKDTNSRYLAGQIRNNCMQMSAIIDGLLGFARSGAVATDEVTNLGEVLDELGESLCRSAKLSGASLVIEPHDRELWVGCEKGALVSVISNLLENSIKVRCGIAYRGSRDSGSRGESRPPRACRD
jgi:signal transduction histidine kinase